MQIKWINVECTWSGISFGVGGRLDYLKTNCGYSDCYRALQIRTPELVQPADVL